VTDAFITNLEVILIETIYFIVFKELLLYNCKIHTGDFEEAAASIFYTEDGSSSNFKFICSSHESITVNKSLGCQTCQNYM
jgi:hypothetical protein